MAFSFSRLIIPEADIVVYKKAINFFDKNSVQIKPQGTAACTGKINKCEVWIGFRQGVPAWECSCTKNKKWEVQKPCFHTLAMSLMWDRSRNVLDPSMADVKYLLGVQQ